MPQSLAAHDSARYLNAALVAYHTLVPNAPIFSAIAFVILGRAENALGKQAIFFRPLGAIVDRFRFQHFPMRPCKNFFRRCDADPQRLKVLTAARFGIVDGFDVKPECLKFVHQYIERRGKIRPLDLFPADNGFVCRRTPQDVVRLDGKHFLKRLPRPVSFERPHFHFSESLAAELRLSAQWLLCDERIRADRAHVHLVLHQMVQLHYVDLADSNRTREQLSRPSVVKFHLPAFGKSGALKFSTDRLLARRIKARRYRAITKLLGGPSQMRFQYLPEVHPGNNAQRIQDDINRRSVLEIRHILHGADLRDNALVPVPAGKLVSRLNFSDLRDLNLDPLDNARFELIPLVTRKYFYSHNPPLLSVREHERGIFHIGGFFSKNGAKQALLGRKFGLSLGRNFPDQNVAGLHFGADPDNAFLVQILKFFFRGVRNVGGGYLGTKLRIPHVTIIILDVYRSEKVVSPHSIRKNNGVFKIRPLP